MRSRPASKESCAGKLRPRSCSSGLRGFYTKTSLLMGTWKTTTIPITAISAVFSRGSWAYRLPCRLVYILLGQRVGLPIKGVGLPGHFIVRYGNA